MTTGPVRRRAAVMFIDMVGYSALMHRNESRALGLVKELEAQLRHRLPVHQGTLVKLLGDGSIAVFNRARDAVEFAVALQRALATRNSVMPPEVRFLLRIGIHAGEIVEEAGDILGDAVNIAARLQPLADPGGIALSPPVYDEVRDWTSLGLASVRGVRLKNIAEPVTVWFVPPPGVRLAWWRLRKNRRSVARALVGIVLLAAALSALHLYRHRTIRHDLLGPGVTWHPWADTGSTIFLDAAGAREAKEGVRMTFVNGRSVSGATIELDTTGRPAWRGSTALELRLKSGSASNLAIQLFTSSEQNRATIRWTWVGKTGSAWSSVIIPLENFIPDSGGAQSAVLEPSELITINFVVPNFDTSDAVDIGAIALTQTKVRPTTRQPLGTPRLELRSTASLNGWRTWTVPGATCYADAVTADGRGAIWFRAPAVQPGLYYGLFMDLADGQRDWRMWKYLELTLRGSVEADLYFGVVEQGRRDPVQEGENWGWSVKLRDTWLTTRIPLSQLGRGSWLPPDADRDNVITLDRILRVQFMLPPTGGSVFISSVALVP